VGPAELATVPEIFRSEPFVVQIALVVLLRCQMHLAAPLQMRFALERAEEAVVKQASGREHRVTLGSGAPPKW
jgi:hypothetical protein